LNGEGVLVWMTPLQTYIQPEGREDEEKIIMHAVTDYIKLPVSCILAISATVIVLMHKINTIRSLAVSILTDQSRYIHRCVLHTICELISFPQLADILQ